MGSPNQDLKQGTMGSDAQKKAQYKNWLIYRARGMVGNMNQFKTTVGQEECISPETFTELRKACSAFENAVEEIIKELRNVRPK